MSDDEQQLKLAHAFGGVSGLVFHSFRYYLGRKTIAANGFAKTLAKNFHLIDNRLQDLIKWDLEHEFERDDWSRKMDHRIHPLGQDMDREAWQMVRDVYTEHIDGSTNRMKTT